jgi:hypothetical protein
LRQIKFIIIIILHDAFLFKLLLSPLLGGGERPVFVLSPETIVAQKSLLAAELLFLRNYFFVLFRHFSLLKLVQFMLQLDFCALLVLGFRLQFPLNQLFFRQFVRVFHLG